MPKLKTHKGTAKRLKRTPSGKLMRRHSFRNHNLHKKSSARKRPYSGVFELKGSAKKKLSSRMGK